MTIAERIKAVMKTRGISQNRLAKAAQISQSGLSSILSGAVSPKENTLQAIAAALGVSLPALISEETKKEAPSQGLDDRLVEMLVNLSPDQVQRVMDFVAGMKAADKA